MDFGLTSVIRGANSVLVTGIRGYTPAWTAPELLLEVCDKATTEADIFAFGMVVIEVRPCASLHLALEVGGGGWMVRLTFEPDQGFYWGIPVPWSQRTNLH